MEDQHGFQTQALRKIGGRWMVEAFPNTNSLPVRKFPMEPAPARP